MVSLACSEAKNWSSCKFVSKWWTEIGSRLPTEVYSTSECIRPCMHSHIKVHLISYTVTVVVNYVLSLKAHHLNDEIRDHICLISSQNLFNVTRPDCHTKMDLQLIPCILWLSRFSYCVCHVSAVFLSYMLS